MKAGDFTNRKARPKTTSQQVIIGDTTTESALRVEIARLKYIESERDTWKAKAESNQADIDRFSSENARQRGESGLATDEILALKTEIIRTKGFESKWQNSKDDRKKIAAEYAEYITESQTLRTANVSLLVDLEAVKGSLAIQTSKLDVNSTIISNLRSDNSTMAEFIEATKGRAAELSELEDNLNKRERVLETENQTLAIEIETLMSQISFYVELKKKFDDEIEFATKELASANKDLTRYRTRATKLVGDVSQGKQDLDDAQVLHEDMNQTIGVLEARMAVLRRKAETPVYMSMSMIEKMEGFKMPSGTTPIRNGLGQGRPTLFRKAG